MSIRFLRHVWGLDWHNAAEAVLYERHGLTWYNKPTTSRLQERLATRIRERWFWRVNAATTALGALGGYVAITVGTAIFKALT